MYFIFDHWDQASGLGALALAMVACLASHALCDFFQGSLSGLKRRLLPSGQAKASLALWLPWLGLHAGFHGLGVAIALGDPALGACEAVAHALIDFCKCEGKIGTWADQALHVACKALWIFLRLAGHL